MTEKQRLIEDLLDSAGFRERIVIGMYDKGRIYFHINFSDELANGLMSSAFFDENIYNGIKELASNLNAILEGIGQYQPEDDQKLH